MFEHMKDKIKSIDIVANEFEITLFSKSGNSFDLKKKSRKGEVHKLDTFKNEHLVGCTTPNNNLDSHRDLCCSNFRSPQTRKKNNHPNKMSSLPVSPGKEKATPKKHSPFKEDINKKFKKNKK
jgi:hypothetical protein